MMKLKNMHNVLKNRKSQLVKTNGFAAIMAAFPKAYTYTGGGTFRDYYQLLEKLKGKISWIPNPNRPEGTGRKFQKSLTNSIEDILYNNGIKNR